MMCDFDPMSVPAIAYMGVVDGVRVLDDGPRTWAEAVWLNLYEDGCADVRLRLAAQISARTLDEWAIQFFEALAQEINDWLCNYAGLIKWLTEEARRG